MRRCSWRMSVAGLLYVKQMVMTLGFVLAQQNFYTNLWKLIEATKSAFRQTVCGLRRKLKIPLGNNCLSVKDENSSRLKSSSLKIQTHTLYNKVKAQESKVRPWRK